MNYKKYALNYQWNGQPTVSLKERKSRKKVFAKYGITIFILLLSTILYIFPFVKKISNNSIELVSRNRTHK